MKNFCLKITGALALIAAIPAQAQTQYPGAQGYLLGRYRSYAAELPILSSLNNGFGTARSTAMGGAYTSLGADLSSMAINPAGLGMYRSSEFGFSPSLTISSHTNDASIVTSGRGEDNTAFKPNNIGIALNLYEGLGGLTSFTFGFSYNRVADFNYNSSVSLAPDTHSLGELFALQLWGIDRSIIDVTSNPWSNPDIFPNEWGAVLGYQTGLVGAYPEPLDQEWKNVPSNDPRFANKYEELKNRTYYLKGAQGADLLFGHDMNTISKGSIGEYNISGGFNLRNKIYLGFSLGLQDIYQKQNVTYTETYYNNEATDPASHMSYSQFTKIIGSGVNMKFGIIANPLPGLRLGLSIHTPTWNTITKRYSAAMSTAYQTTSYYNSSDTWVYQYKFTTQPRLLTGASYTFSDKAIVSVDYECAFYNWMRIRVPDIDRYYYVNGVEHDEFLDLKNAVKNDYKPRHTVRVGVEVRPVAQFAIRGGFAYQGSFLRDNDKIFNEPLPYKSMNVSGGLGYRINDAFSIDLAYVYMKTDYSGYDLFYYYGRDNRVNGTDLISYDEAIESKLSKHNIVLSVNVRF